MLRIVSDIGDTAQWVISICIIIFLAQYTVYAKWWHNFIGRSVVLLDLCILGIVGPSLAVLADPQMAGWFQSAGYAYLETCVLLVAVYTVISRILGWRRIRRGRNERTLPGERARDHSN